MTAVRFSVLALFVLVNIVFVSYAQATVSDLNKGKPISAKAAVALLQLNTNTAFSGQFVQKKYFKILKKPFISKGEFNANEQQFVWRTLTPIKNAIIFRDETLYIENAQGELTQQDKAKDVGYLMQQLLSGQFAQLSEHFSLSQADNSNQQACLLLRATSKSFAQVVNKVKLCGQTRIANITLYDPQNNATDIALTYALPVTANDALVDSSSAQSNEQPLKQ
mgnify:CR=1 FL=1